MRGPEKAERPGRRGLLRLQRLSDRVWYTPLPPLTAPYSLNKLVARASSEGGIVRPSVWEDWFSLVADRNALAGRLRGHRHNRDLCGDRPHRRPALAAFKGWLVHQSDRRITLGN
jgi:hypothetical protein